MIRAESMKRRGRSGSGLVEFAITLIAVMIILGGFVQIIRVGITRSDSLAESTRRATREMMRSGETDDGGSYNVGSGSLSYLNNWNLGGDDAPHTADDQAQFGNSGAIFEEILEETRTGALGNYVPDNAFTELDQTGDLLDGYNFAVGVAPREDVDVLPVVRNLIYNEDEIEVRTRAVFPWTKGLY